MAKYLLLIDLCPQPLEIIAIPYVELLERASISYVNVHDDGCLHDNGGLIAMVARANSLQDATLLAEAAIRKDC